MKSFKTIYMTLYNGDIIFPKNVSYYEEGYYVCKGQNNMLYFISSKDMIKLNQDDLYKLIMVLTKANTSGVVQIFKIKNIDGSVDYNISIYPNCTLKCNNCSCTVYVPHNCSRWEHSILVGYDNDSYILEPCDEKGRVIERKRKEVNPYTNNCNIVYNIISKNPDINTYEIIDLLGWPPNSVTSRLSELMTGGRIYSTGRVSNPRTGRKVHKWMTTDTVEGACYVL